MNEQTAKPTIPAYTSYKGFSRLMRQFGELENLPSHIDRSVLSTMSGSQQSSMLQSLQYLGLIDGDGRPTPALKQLVKASGAEYGPALRKIVTAAYGFIFPDGLDLKTTTTNKLEQKFREQKAQGSTIYKGIAFFLACCKDAGIEVSKFVKTPTVTPTRPPRRSGVGGRNNEELDDDEDDDARSQVDTDLAGVHPLIRGLIKELPEPGEAWPDADRKTWAVALNAVFALVYPQGGAP